MAWLPSGSLQHPAALLDSRTVPPHTASPPHPLHHWDDSKADRSVWKRETSDPVEPSMAVGTYSYRGLELWRQDDGSLPSGLAKPLLQAMLN